jgi:hypothetical protein
LKYKENFCLFFLCAAAQKGLFSTLFFNGLSFGGTLPGNFPSSFGRSSHSGAAEPLPKCGWKCSKWTCSNFGQIWMCPVWGKMVHLDHSEMGLFSCVWSETECRGLETDGRIQI